MSTRHYLVELQTEPRHEVTNARDPYKTEAERNATRGSHAQERLELGPEPPENPLGERLLIVTGLKGGVLGVSVPYQDKVTKAEAMRWYIRAGQSVVAGLDVRGDQVAHVTHPFSEDKDLNSITFASGLDVTPQDEEDQIEDWLRMEIDSKA